jgi:hypothetical protein
VTAGADASGMATSAPNDPKAPGLGRRRTIVLTAVVGLGALVVGTAVVNRAAGTSRARGPETSGTQPVAVRFPATSGSTRPRSKVTVPKPTVPKTTSTLASPGTTAGFVVSPPASGPDPTAPIDTEPATTTTATPTTILSSAVTATLPPPPPPFGAHSLTWTAPTSMTIPSGTTAPLTVLAYNPTGRSVSLSHPLSCTPRLDHGEVCPDIVQLIGSHRSAGAHYTIDATGVVAGSYTLTIEGVLTVNVTVS